eukprot:TRINITY_DN8107_c1_g1_i1.p1 TRINITY_DN8107_c1_g1~~TRINITY_DN8107_c1_g1_i1.p1  ORF type:complete len:2417 (-),score=769.50 TRINITY_DN8107_c1_g1_i1:100-7350(-)
MDDYPNESQEGVQSVRADTEAILYDLWELDSWTEEAKPPVSGRKRSHSLLGNLYNNVSDSLQFNGRGFNSLLYSNIRRALEVDGTRSVKAQLAFSDDGTQLFVTQNDVLMARSLPEEFEQGHKVIDVPEDPQPQWRQMAYSVEHRVLAVVSSGGQFIIVNSRGRPVHHFLARDVGLSVDVAAVVFRDGVCEAEGTSRCPELLVLGFDGVLRRVHLPIVPHGPVHPAGENKTCAEAAAPINLFPYHHSVSCMALSPSEGWLAVGGGDVDDADGTSSYSLSWWRLTDSAPYAELRHASKAETGRGRLSTFFRSMRNRVLRIENKALLVKLVFSPSGRQLAGLDLSGTITLWSAQSFAKTHSFGLDGLPPAGVAHDVAWWSEGALIVAKRDGQMAVWSTAGALLIARDSPVPLEPRPLVTSARDGRFFVLDCEEKAMRAPRFGGGDAESEEDEDEEEARRKAAEAARLDEASPHRKYLSMSGVVWLLSMGLFSIDDELFPRKFSFGGRPRQRQATQRVYRLHCFKSTTPLELFHRKVAEKDFGVALALAKKYGLDTDLIYQTQWLDAEVSKERISDYLDKINDREWVRLECQNRIPSNLRASKLLLEYGLKHSQTTPIDPSALFRDSEEAQLSLHRLVFLRFLDRLDSYTAIYKGEYNADDWARFRERDAIEMAVAYAQDENYHALQVLFTYHGDDTLPYRRLILGKIPETAAPADYEHLLSELELDADAYAEDELDNRERTWSQKSWRKAADWVEASAIVARLGLSLEDSRSLTALKAAQARSGSASAKKDARPAPACAVVPADYKPAYPILSVGLTEWYIRRAREIDARSGQVDNAVSLLALADKHDVENIEAELTLMRMLATLVYECGLVDMSVEKLEAMSEYDRFELLLRDSTADTIVDNLTSRASALIAQDDDNADPSHEPMLLRYLLKLSRDGRMDLVRAVVHRSRPAPEVAAAGRIIKDDERLMEWTLACVYENPKSGPWNVISDIFTCMPLRDREAAHAARYERLHDRVDAFDAHLTAAELLSKYNLAPPLKFFVDLGSDAARQESARQLIVKACLQSVQAKPAVTAAHWTQLLQDLLALQTKVFSFIPVKEIYTQYVQSVLKAGHFDLAKRQLSQLGTVEAERLVLESAREYFNSAATVSDTAMAQASEALSIIPVSPAVTAETHLINAVAMLASHGVTLLPLQIRLHADRRQLIRAALHTDPSAYKIPSAVQRLATLLGVVPPGSKSSNPASQEVQLMIGLSAFEHGDRAAAYATASSLIQDSYTPVWELARDLGSCSALDTAGRLHMISYAMARCPPEQLPELMSVWHILQGRQCLESVGIQHTYTPSEVNRGAPSEAEESAAALQTLQKFQLVAAKLNASASNVDRSPSEASVSCGVVRHPFYTSDTGSHERFARHYEPRSAAGVESSRGDELPGSEDISERLFRLYALAPKTPGSDGVAGVEPASVESWVIETARRHLLTKDWASGVAHLNSLRKFTACSELFDSWLEKWADDASQSEAILSLAVYVHSLELLASRTDADGVAAVQAMPTASVIAQVERELRDLRQSAPAVAATDEVVEQLSRYQRMMFDSVVARDMKVIDPSVDIGRFTTDAAYRRQCLLRLARSAGGDSLAMALRLARQSDDLAEWRVIYEHVEWLLTGHAVSADVRTSIQVHLPLLLQHWSDVLARLWATLEKIPGTAHARLAAAYDVIDDCYGRSTADPPSPNDPPRAQIRLYQQLLAALPGIQPAIDFKALVEPGGALAAVGAVLTEQNVFLIAKLAKKHPELQLPAGDLFRRLVENIADNASSPVADRFRAVEQYLDRLADDDLLAFVSRLVLSAEGRAHPVALRMNLVDAALRPLEARSSKPRRSGRNKKPEEPAEKHEQDATVERLRVIKAHLDVMRQLDYVRPERQSLFEDLDKAAADQSKVESVLLEHLGCQRLPLPLLAHVGHLFVRSRPDLFPDSKRGKNEVSPTARLVMRLLETAADRVLDALRRLPSSSGELADTTDSEPSSSWPPATPTESMATIAAVGDCLQAATSHPSPIEPAVLEEVRSAAISAWLSALQLFSRDPEHALSARVAVLECSLRADESGRSLYDGRSDEDERKLLERLKVEHVVGTSWGADALQRIQDGGGISEKEEQFTHLLASSPPERPELLGHLAALLQVWRDVLLTGSTPNASKSRASKAETAPAEDPLHRCWLRLMEAALERYADPAAAADFVADLRAGAARDSLTAEEEESLIAKVDERHPLLVFELGLLSPRKNVVDTAVSKMLLSARAAASSPVVRPDPRLVSLVLSRGLLPRLANTPFFTSAAQYLVEHGTDTDNAALSMPYAVALLTMSRHVEHASSLVMSVSSISPWSLLFGAGSGRTLLRTYLDSQHKRLAKVPDSGQKNRPSREELSWRAVADLCKQAHDLYNKEFR